MVGNLMFCRAYCTAICKSDCGDFKDTLSDNLLAPVLKAVIEKTNLCSNEVGDIVVGTILAPGSIRAMERMMTAFYAGFPGSNLPQLEGCQYCATGKDKLLSHPHLAGALNENSGTLNWQLSPHPWVHSVMNPTPN
ncbi:3-ketoacyl-CoA thiolase 5, peroxisomal [Capsicum chinense]|nr:3-ketoacyl-CoA thiolase 5, peroxisomal [Capsicum chinense]